jgi:3-hydroxyisobutyrate dehydrogenase-like beta-hydroxyacid dehydrogenase
MGTGAWDIGISNTASGASGFDYHAGVNTERDTGLIGVGLLGIALAERLLQAGFRVTGHDLSPARREALRALGGEVAESAEAVAERCGVVVVCLPHSGVTADVLPAMRGGLVIDTTTGSPEEMAGFGAALAGRGVGYVDATIGGSSAVVREGHAVILCGGTAEAFEDARSRLSCFGSKLFHLGPAGAGARMKLVVNLVLGLNRAVLAEGLSFAERSGVDPAVALEVLKAGAAYSRAMDAKGRRMLEADYAPEARLRQHHKDVRLILAEAARAGAYTPLSELHDRLLSAAEEAGFGESDNAAVIEAYRAGR